MQFLRRVSAASSLRTAATRSVRGGLRPFSSINTKERGEEAVYFQREDERLKADLKKKMDEILQLHDSHEQKVDLVKLLGVKKEEDKDQSLISKLGLDDWKMAVPLGILVAIPALANEVIILGPESQLAGCFVLFCATLYTQVGPMASKFFQDYQDNVAKDLKQVDDNMMIEVNQSIVSTKQLLDLEQEVSAVNHLRDDLAVVQADTLNHLEQHKFRDAIAKKLDSLIALEEAAAASIRTRMVTKVKSEVVQSFTKDAKAKEKALEQALAILSAGVGAKRGKDVVGEAFIRSIGTYREDYKKKPASEDPIIVQLEKDVAAIAQPPLVSYQATNVYVSHPLQVSARPAVAVPSSKKH